MSDVIAALGEKALLDGFSLAGASVVAAETDSEVRQAWSCLTGHAGVVILTPRAAKALGAAVADPRSPLSVVLPS